MEETKKRIIQYLENNSYDFQEIDNQIIVRICYGLKAKIFLKEGSAYSLEFKVFSKNPISSRINSDLSVSLIFSTLVLVFSYVILLFLENMHLKLEFNYFIQLFIAFVIYILWFIYFLVLQESFKILISNLVFTNHQ